MAQTYEYVSDRRLLYFTQKLKEHFPTAASFIDDTTAAINKVYSSSKTNTLLDGKVDKVTGKQLSTNDFTNTYKSFIDDFDITDYIDDNSTTAQNKLWSASKIYSTISQLSGLEFRKVTTLPATGEAGVIYLLPIRNISATTTVASGSVTVNKSTFVSKISQNGSYTFTYNGTAWTYSGSPVTLATYGIALAGTPANNDTITVVLASATGSNIYEEYIWITADSAYELIGTTEVDLSDYVKHDDMQEITTSEIDNIIQEVFS